MSNLENTIQSLASTFAANVVAMLRGASIRELLDITGAKTAGGGSEVGNGRKPRAATGGRLPRRSAGDLGAMVSQIVSELAKSEAGLRSEELRAALGVDRKELPRPLKEALSSGAITKMGEKRATVYFAARGGESSNGGRAPRGGAPKKKAAAKK